MFNTRTEIWEFIEPPASVPPGRSGHAITEVFGDIFFIFGGQNANGYLNDFYLYSFASNQWTALVYDNPPNARAGACMTISFPTIYIYGGYNDNGCLDDFWSVNIYQTYFLKITADGVEVPPLQNHYCVVDTHNNVIMLSGETLYDQTNPDMFYYSSAGNKWSIVESDPKLAYANAGFIVMNDIILMIGGRKNIEAQQEIILIQGSTIKVIGNLPMPMSSHAVAYSGRNIYVFGGLEIIGKSMMLEQGTSVFLKISSDSFYCSVGFYGDNCTICGPGTWSSALNSNSCNFCNEGTYSEDYGLYLYSQCFPCANGFFANQAGSSMCLMCSPNDNCPIGSIAPGPKQNIPNIVSTQPKPYDTNKSAADSDNAILTLVLEIALPSLFVFYFLFKWKHLLKKIDIFKGMHKRQYFEEPYATSWGGLFSMLFGIAIFYFLISPVLYYSLANITETKSLVPVFTLDNSAFPAKYMIVTITLYNFGGTCAGESNSCSSEVEVAMSGQVSEKNYGPFCYKNAGACTINVSCSNCYFEQSSRVNISVYDVLIYTTGIEAEFQSFSSIPDEPLSSMKFYVEPGQDKVFNGLNPTIFYMTAIPSVR